MSMVSEPRKRKKRKTDEDLSSMRAYVTGIKASIPIEKYRVDQFERHPQNRLPKPEAVEEIAKSIKGKGQISPITARRREGHERYQILCGETRWRAHQLLGEVLIEARVIECTDAEALIYMGADNLDRKDLTPSERARHARNLLDVGYSREQVAAELKLNSPASVSNLVKLIEAPECWLAALDDGVMYQGERRQVHEGTVREIAKFSQVPELAEKILGSFATGRWFPTHREQQIDAIYGAVNDMTRSMTAKSWYGQQDGIVVNDHHKPRFKVDDFVRARLKVASVPTSDGQVEEVALNVEEFDRLQWEALAKLVARKAKDNGKTGSVATDASKQKQQDEQLAKWCREWKYWLLRCEMSERLDFTMASWLLPWLMINAVRDHHCTAELLVHYAVDGYWLDPDDRKDEPLVYTLIRAERDAVRQGSLPHADARREMFLRIAKLILWPADQQTRDKLVVSDGIPERLPFLRSDEIDAVAKSMEVTLTDAWQAGSVDASAARALVAQFLRRHTCPQLEELADELGVKLNASGKAAMVSELLGLHKAGSPLPVPAVLAEKKARTKGGVV